MHGLLLISALWLIDPRAGRFDVSGGAAAELRGGYAPVTVLTDSEPTFLMIVTPNVDFRYHTRRFGTLGFGTGLRMQLRSPNRLSIKRPIFLTQFYTDYFVQATRRFSLDIDMGASVGELDYTGVAVAFGSGQAAVPDFDVAQIGVGQTTITMEGSLTPTQRLIVQPNAEVRAPIGRTADAQDEGRINLPQQTLVNLGLAYQHDASVLDTVGAEIRPGVVDYNDTVTFLSTQGMVHWNRQIRRGLSSQLDLGLFGANVLRAPEGSDADEQGTQVFPVGSLRFNGLLFGRSNVQLSGNLGAGVQGYFDRITERVEPRANLTAGLFTAIPPQWDVGISMAAFTALTTDPRDPVRDPVTDGLLEVPETVISGQTPVTYTINDRTQFEFGTVFSFRGSHLGADDPEFTQFEGWFYVAIRAAGGTARGGEEVAERESGSIGVGLRGLGTTAGGR